MNELPPIGETPPEDENSSSELARVDSETKSNGSLEPLPGRCGARLRASDPPRYCQKNPMKGRERCRLHGGLSLRGIANPSYQGKGYTKDVPARLLERMLEAIDDPELTSLRTELALLDARMGEILGSLSERGHSEALAALSGAVVSLERVSAAPDMDNREEALEKAVLKARAAVDDMRAEKQAWVEIYQLVDRRRRTAGVELKREEFLEHTMQHQQALWFFQQLLAAIHEIIPDQAVKERLAIKISKIMNREPPKALLLG